MGKIFSLMNQDEYTPVPITLQPRSPYFALLDFCHFKANETSERQGRDRRKSEIERMARSERSPPWAPTIDAKPPVPSRLSFGAIKRETRKRGGEISRTINFKANLKMKRLWRDAPSL